MSHRDGGHGGPYQESRSKCSRMLRMVIRRESAGRRGPNQGNFYGELRRYIGGWSGKTAAAARDPIPHHLTKGSRKRRQNMVDR